MARPDGPLLAGAIAKRFTEVVGVFTAAIAVTTGAFYAHGKWKGRKAPADKAYWPGLLWGLGLGALILCADAIWG